MEVERVTLTIGGTIRVHHTPYTESDPKRFTEDVDDAERVRNTLQSFL